MECSSCGTGTPARMEMRSLPVRASRMPSSWRTGVKLYGLQPRRTTSASVTARTFSLTRTVRLSVRSERAVRMRWAEAGRVTQAMKRFGILGGRSSAEGVGVSGVSSLREERMPERIAVLRVPVQNLSQHRSRWGFCWVLRARRTYRTLGLSR